MKTSKFASVLSTDVGYVIWNRMFGGVVYVPVSEDVTWHKALTHADPVRTGKKHLGRVIVHKDMDEDFELQAAQEQVLSQATNAKRLRCLELSVSEACNYRCTYCTFWRYKSDRPRLMPLALAKRAVIDFVGAVEQVVQPVLYFGTAEPLLNWRVIKEVVPLALSLHSGIRFNLITNASLLNIEKLEFCQRHGIYVGLSLDGTAETQRRQRSPASRFIDSHEAVLRALLIGKQLKFTFSCLSGTYRQLGFEKDIAYLIDLCTEHGIQEFDIDYDTNSLASADEIELVADELISSYYSAQQQDLSVFGYWLIPYHNIIDMKQSIKSFCGNVVGESVCVAADGGFKLCGYEPKAITAYHAISEHLNSDAFREICWHRLPGNNSMCRGCEIEGACAGQCALRPPGGYPWQAACLLYRTATRKLLSRYRDNSDLGIVRLQRVDTKHQTGSAV